MVWRGEGEGDAGGPEPVWGTFFRCQRLCDNSLCSPWLPGLLPLPLLMYPNPFSLTHTHTHERLHSFSAMLMSACYISFHMPNLTYARTHAHSFGVKVPRGCHVGCLHTHARARTDIYPHSLLHACTHTHTHTQSRRLLVSVTYLPTHFQCNTSVTYLPT